MRMPDPTAPQCDCTWLANAAEDPTVPISFDGEINEYYIVSSAVDGGRWNIYHCPFCGGSVLKSKREQLFETITTEESIRLSNITRDIETIEGAIDILGDPDFDNSRGTGVTEPDRGSEPGKTEFFRTLSYHHISNVAIVQITLYPGEGIKVSLVPKSIEWRENER